jgi:hypothetical protein
MLLRIKHPVDQKSGHSHTTLIVNQDKNGRFWLSALCAKSGCKGHVLVEILPGQVKQWQELELGIWEMEGKEDDSQQNAA